MKFTIFAASFKFFITKIAEFFRKRNQEFKPNDNEITVIYTRNDFQLNPMTAWIMAHRFAHMISSYIEEVIEEIYFLSNEELSPKNHCFAG